MLPKLNMLFGYYAVCLSGPLPQAQGGFIGIVPELGWAVKGDLR
jgi:hypothetical protein